MRLVIIESPYSGAIERNLHYLRACIRDSVLHGESPYASHLMLPGALDDSIPAERLLGLQCGYAWWRAADLVAFYINLGLSEGMEMALNRAIYHGIKWEERSIAYNPD